MISAGWSRARPRRPRARSGRPSWPARPPNSPRPTAIASDRLSFSRGLGDDAVGPFVAIWQAAAVLLLLIACANIANLLLARGTERQPEFAIRLALGASRGRLVLQLLIEGLCLAVLGVGVGVGLAALAIGLSRDFLPATVVRFVPGYEYIRLDTGDIAAMAGVGARPRSPSRWCRRYRRRAPRAGGPLLSGARSATAPPDASGCDRCSPARKWP